MTVDLERVRKIARRISEEYKLTVPVNLETIVAEEM